MNHEGIKSAKRTDGNSPAIHRWERSNKESLESAKRTREISPSESRSVRALSSASRTNDSICRRGIRFRSLLIISLSIFCACQQRVGSTHQPLKPPEQQTETRALPAGSSPNLKLVIDGAIEQVGKTTSYDPSYQKLDYPDGDVPIETGVCSDVIVRAFRKANIDLQKDVHEDMKGSFSAYPTKWGLSKPDANIDHRRVPNLQTFLTRKGKLQSITSRSDDFLPGDIVTWDLGGGVDHVGLVTNVWFKPTQRYLIVHNIGAGTRMEDVMFAWKITGHYRYF